MIVSTVSRLPGSPRRRMMVAGCQAVRSRLQLASVRRWLTSFGSPSYSTTTGSPAWTEVGTDVKDTPP